MSTIDPAEAARQRLERRAGGLLLLLVTIILCIGLGVLTGIGGTQAMDMPRIMSLNSVFAWEFAESPVPFLLLGIVGSLVAGLLHGAAARRYSGGRVFVAGFAWIMLGITGGFAWAIPSWTEPLAVGVAIDPVFGDDEKWDAVAWIWYSVPHWLPILAAVVTILVFVVSLGRSGRQKRLESRMVRLLQAGVRTEAIVTAVAETGIEIGGDPLIDFTVSFTDQNGTRRWVTKKKPIERASVPRVDDRAMVVYRPESVSQEKKILVAFGSADDLDRQLRHPQQ